MSITTIANRYARALADVITERGETEEVMSELTGFAKLISDNDELSTVFASPVLAVERKRGVLNELLARMTLRQTSKNFLHLLASYSRLQNLDEILVSLRREIDIRTDSLFAEVTTAREISEQEKNSLRDRLKTATGKEMRLQFNINPEIIGGVVTRIGSLVYDGSIRAQLDEMKQRLINS